jgi:hypothetical protein
MFTITALDPMECSLDFSLANWSRSVNCLSRPPLTLRARFMGVWLTPQFPRWRSITVGSNQLPSLRSGSRGIFECEKGREKGRACDPVKRAGPRGLN